MTEQIELIEQKEQRIAPKRIASAVLNALKGGVVPRVGLEYIAVGRAREIEALLRDTEIIEDGGATFRFVVGRYGSGKSFLLQIIRNYANDRGFVVADADLSPERRLAGTKGQGLATYRELMKNISIKTRPDGGALPLILEKWISGIKLTVAKNGVEIGSAQYGRAVEQRIIGMADSLEGMVGGYDFAAAILKYYRADEDGDDETKAAVLRYLRGEYQTKTEVMRELGLRSIISDENWYEYLKLFSAFLVKSGYKGMLIMVDELVNLFRVPFRVTREYNYEKLLSIYNDALQGKASHIGFIFGVTPQCLEDTERGIFSYEALKSRLQDGKYADQTVRDLLSPIIRIQPLTFEELYVLLEKVSGLHKGLHGVERELSRDDYVAFLKAEFERVGADTYATPRAIIRDFIEIENRLAQDSELTMTKVLGANGAAFTMDGEDDDLPFADFTV
ncbi:biotin carboxylase [Clostridia bacterium]|nr:biotin carboxylase [Clostridia bacterium]